ncbi:MAG: SurA N-terminal domain-containing protein [Candidatus Omnitrophota bacterium]
MLQFLRKRENIKKIMWGLAILVIPAFVLWGSGSAVRERNAPKYAGLIFGQKVSFRDYEAAFAAVRTDALLRYGEALNKIVQFLNFEQLTWERLIVMSEAAKEKIKVVDEEIISFIQSLPLFQKDGRFDQARYNSIINYSFRLNPREFEEQIRQELMIEKLRQQITKEVTITDKEAEKEYAQRNERAKAAYIFFGPDAYLGEIHPSLEEAQGYFDQHKEEFKKPEQVNVLYAGFTYERATELFPVEVADEEINEYYQQHRDEFAPKEEANPEQPADQENAEEDSPDEEPAEAPIALSEETKSLIKAKLTQEKAREALEDRVWQMADEASNTPAAFEQIAQNHGAAVKETGFFEAQEPIAELGLSYEFAQAAFALKVGEASDVITTPQGSFILRVKEKKPPFVPDFSAVEEQSEQAVIKQKALGRAQEKAQEMLVKLKELLQDNKSTFTDAAKKLSLEPKETEEFTRNGYISVIGRSPEFAQAVFGLASGEASEVIAVPNGYCIASLVQLFPIDQEKFGQEKESFKETLLGKRKNDFYMLWLETLKEKAGLVDRISPLKSAAQP